MMRPNFDNKHSPNEVTGLLIGGPAEDILAG